MYILGWGLPWRLTTLPGALIPILPILLLALLPETPTWLLGKGRREDALQSLAKYIVVGNKNKQGVFKVYPVSSPRTDGTDGTNQPKVVQEVLADLKNIDLIPQRNLNTKTSRNPGHSNACGCQHRYMDGVSTLEDIRLITNA